MRLRIAIGPTLPGWGSWEWIGADLGEELQRIHEVTYFNLDWKIGDVDVVLIVKHRPPTEILKKLCDQPVVYMPVDWYDCYQAIHDDQAFLRRVDRVVSHCERLRHYFDEFAPVDYLDHHLKYTSPHSPFRPDGPVLWTGVRSNLDPLAAWINQNPIPSELWVLTNPEDPRKLDPKDYGFRAHQKIQLGVWSPERHREWASQAGAAIDVKDNTFRSLHKPPAKVLDSIASGLPTAVCGGSSAAEYLRSMGFQAVAPEEWDRWRSREYWDQTKKLAATLYQQLDRKSVTDRLSAILTDVVASAESRAEQPHEIVSMAEQRVRSGRFAAARRSLGRIKSEVQGTLAARIENNLAVLDALDGNLELANEGFAKALEFEPSFVLANENRATINAEYAFQQRIYSTVDSHQPPQVRVAILSFLFNWPSSGGGITHTVELATFLQRAGYQVQHFFAVNEEFGVGRSERPLEFPSCGLHFSGLAWTRAEIMSGFRHELEQYQPDFVIVTDAWNMKPILARAAANWPTILRFQGLECFCPLNNVRLLPGSKPNTFEQCPLNQLATPRECAKCVQQLGQRSGSLHQLERDLAGVGSADYDRILHEEVARAAAIMVVNPTIITSPLKMLATRTA